MFRMPHSNSGAQRLRALRSADGICGVEPACLGARVSGLGRLSRRLHGAGAKPGFVGYRQPRRARRRRVRKHLERMDVSRTAVDLAASQAGGLDTAWVAYNNFFNGSGHIFAGKLEVPAPSEFSQWLDVTGLSINSSAEITVGEHAYELDANRWGYKFAYVRGSLDAEVCIRYLKRRLGRIQRLRLDAGQDAAV